MSANLHRPDFDEIRDQPGFRARRARIGRQIGTDKLGVSLWEVDPGEAAYPLHLHLSDEELLVVLDGRPSLRTPDGWRELEPGDVLSFPAGEESGHQIVNRGDEAARFLAVSTQSGADIVLYPDSGKLGAAERVPDGSGLLALFRLADQVGYYDGEAPPSTD